MQNTTQKRLTESSLATFYGCCGLFDLCGKDDLISLTMAGSSPLLDWLMFEGTNECVIEYNMIDWIRPENGTRAGWLADPCADPPGSEFGNTCYRINDFGRLRFAAPTRDITKVGLKYCEKQPVYRVDGTRVDNDLEWGAFMAMQNVSAELHREIIDGSTSTAGQFDGLQQIVSTGYIDCNGKRATSMDSIVVDWNGNQLDGGAGITWTDGRGARNIGSTYNFIDTLLDIVRTIRQRIKMAPLLKAQNMQVGDMILLVTSQMARCILDAYTCWSVCPGQQFNEANIDTLEGRNFRNEHLGGLFGDGRIFLDGFEIPILAYDWNLQTGNTTSDVYVLTRGVGNQMTMMGQYNDFEQAPLDSISGETMFTTDDGRFLHGHVEDYTCVSQWSELQPRIVAYAPWTLARIQDVSCRTPGGYVSNDPLDTSFFPERSFSVAVC